MLSLFLWDVVLQLLNLTVMLYKLLSPYLGSSGSHVNAMIIDTTNIPGPSFQQQQSVTSPSQKIDIERRTIVGNCNQINQVSLPKSIQFYTFLVQIQRHTEDPMSTTPLLSSNTSSSSVNIPPTSNMNRRPNKFIPLSVLPSNPSPSTSSGSVTPSSVVERRSLYKSASREPESASDVDQICTLASPDDDTSL